MIGLITNGSNFIVNNNRKKCFKHITRKKLKVLCAYFRNVLLFFSHLENIQMVVYFISELWMNYAWLLVTTLYEDNPSLLFLKSQRTEGVHVHRECTDIKPMPSMIGVEEKYRRNLLFLLETKIQPQNKL